MAGQASLLSDLEAIVGSEHTFAPGDGERFAVDGLSPQAIIEPGSYEEVGAVMHYANDNGLVVIPCGHGRRGGVGNVPSGYDIALSVARLNEIIEYEPADLTLTCQAGTTLGHLDASVSSHAQMVPAGARRSDDTSCVGALLACNRSRNLQWGGPRDYTIGLRVVTADGRMTRAGGKVVKNVAGYDLCKLYIGSLGTLGVIVEATFKLVPAPQGEERMELEFASVIEACGFAARLYGRGLSLWDVLIDRPMALSDEGTSPHGPLAMRIYLLGSAAAVDRSGSEISALAQECGVTPLDRTRLPKTSHLVPTWTSRDDPLTCNASVLPTAVPSLIDVIDREAPGAFLNISPLTGRVVATWLGAGGDEPLLCQVKAAVSALGGTTVVESCSSELKRRIDVFGDPPPSFELMRRIKQEFDPKGTLSPGRFVGRL
jgi:glycolate oxidase FAD binding subunit